MGMLSYFDFDTKELMQEVLVLNTYMFECMGHQKEMPSSFDDNNKDGAWRVLTPQDIGSSKSLYNPDDSSFHGERLLNWGAQLNVLGKYDETGSLTSLGISFWGTGAAPGDKNSIWNLLSDVLSYGMDILGPENSINHYVYNAFNDLMTHIVSFAQENGLTGRDIIFTGHSQGGLCVNSMASSSSIGHWDGFFENSAYIALASPTQNNLNDKVLNIGLENDPVYRVTKEDTITPGFLFVHDEALPTCINNLISFNDNYVENNLFSILNSAYWQYGHAVSLYMDALTTVTKSDFHDYTNLNSTLIFAGLSDEKRATTWVEDLNYNALPHTGPTFILGSEQDDLIRGGKGIDYLEGNGGNDTFRDKGGYNIIDGGDGIDTYDTQDHFDYKSWTRDAFGMTWVRDKEGNVSVLNNVEQVKGGYAGWFGIGWNEINGTFTDDGIAFTYAGKSGFKAYSETAQGDIYKGSEVIAQTAAKGESGFLFGGFGNDMLTGTASDEVFFAHEGNDILYLGGGKDVVMTLGENFGHDKIYQFGKDDKLVFMLNSKMETDTSILDYMSVAGNDIVFSFDDNNSVTLVGGASSNLTNDQFVCG